MNKAYINKAFKKNTTASKLSVVYGGKQKPKRFLDNKGNHADSEGVWIYSYADMVTILMMFFILLLSISSVSAAKFEILKQALATTTKNIQQNPQTNQSSTTKYISEGETIGGVPISIISDKMASIGRNKNAQILAGVRLLLAAVDKTALKNQKDKATEFENLRNKLKALQKNLNFIVSSKNNAQEIEIVLPSNNLFNSAKSGQNKGIKFILNEKSKKLIKNLALNIKRLDPNPQINIEAYWSKYNLSKSKELKTMMLTNLQAMQIYKELRILGFKSDLISIAGYGSEKEILPEWDRYGNLDKNAIYQNRRIVLRVHRRLNKGDE